MAKTTVDDMLDGVRRDALAEIEFNSPKRRIQRGVGEALFRLRTGVDLTQAELASRAGWQQPYVDRMERGQAPMFAALEDLAAFARATGTSAVLSFVDVDGRVREQVTLGGDAG